LKTLIGVIGSSSAEKAVLDAAYEVGREIIKAGFSLICGGLGGVMEAACRGAYNEAGENSGRIIGILPGTSRYDANPYVDIAILTGMGYARNCIIACSADAIVAVSGGSGTLSELALAWQYGKPIVVLTGLPGFCASLSGVSIDGRRPDKIMGAKTAAEAISLIKEILKV
jgi:uncharacterized protein (TIGR00725 family)